MVIGAGMAGILTAYFLQEKGLEVIVIEADKIAGGQTKNTTAKITSQHGLIYHDMMKKAGKSRAKGYKDKVQTIEFDISAPCAFLNKNFLIVSL